MIQAVDSWNSGNISLLCNIVIFMVASPVRFLINCLVYILESVKTVCRKKSRGDGRALWPETQAETECGCFCVFCKSFKRQHHYWFTSQIKTLCTSSMYWENSTWTQEPNPRHTRRTIKFNKKPQRKLPLKSRNQTKDPQGVLHLESGTYRQSSTRTLET